MKAYVLTTGLIFLLIVVSHIARLASEGMSLLREPSFAGSSLLSVILVLWSVRIYRTLSKSLVAASRARRVEP